MSGERQLFCWNSWNFYTCLSLKSVIKVKKRGVMVWDGNAKNREAESEMNTECKGKIVLPFSLVLLLRTQS